MKSRLLAFAAALMTVGMPVAALAETRVAETSPQAVVDEVLAADRAFSEASARGELVAGLSAMFDEEVVMPLPGGAFARGRAAAVEALKANPANAGARAEWAPVRGGVSADGQHGFTFGYMTTHRAAGAAEPGKYLAYWVRRPEGWRVLAYKRARRPAGEVSTAMLPPSLPERLVPVDASAVERHRASVAAAEKAFSDEAQAIGIGPAFAKHGRADAMNIGSAPAFTIGSENIAQALFGETKGSPVHWDAGEGAVAASSGDLGVTFGLIRHNGPPPARQPSAASFFTVWKRDNPGEPWRYIAE